MKILSFPGAGFRDSSRWQILGMRAESLNRKLNTGRVPEVLRELLRPRAENRRKQRGFEQKVAKVLSTMIDLPLVKERVDATPFRPFRLETTGGKQIRIVTPDHLLFAPESRDLIIAFEPGGSMHLLSTDQLASLEVEMSDDRA